MAHAAAAAALLCHRQSRHTAYRTLTRNQTVARSPGLSFDGLHPVIRVFTWINTYLPTPLAYLAEP